MAHSNVMYYTSTRTALGQRTPIFVMSNSPSPRGCSIRESRDKERGEAAFSGAFHGSTFMGFRVFYCPRLAQPSHCCWAAEFAQAFSTFLRSRSERERGDLLRKQAAGVIKRERVKPLRFGSKNRRRERERRHLFRCCGLF